MIKISNRSSCRCSPASPTLGWTKFYQPQPCLSYGLLRLFCRINSVGIGHSMMCMTTPTAADTCGWNPYKTTFRLNWQCCNLEPCSESHPSRQTASAVVIPSPGGIWQWLSQVLEASGWSEHWESHCQPSSKSPKWIFTCTAMKYHALGIYLRDEWFNHIKT